jgi:hypothetical protein
VFRCDKPDISNAIPINELLEVSVFRYNRHDGRRMTVHSKRVPNSIGSGTQVMFSLFMHFSRAVRDLTEHQALSEKIKKFKIPEYLQIH